jgi:hypothetical protein
MKGSDPAFRSARVLGKEDMRKLKKPLIHQFRKSSNQQDLWFVAMKLTFVLTCIQRGGSSGPVNRFNLPEMPTKFSVECQQQSQVSRKLSSYAWSRYVH